MGSGPPPTSSGFGNIQRSSSPMIDLEDTLIQIDKLVCHARGLIKSLDDEKKKSRKSGR